MTNDEALVKNLDLDYKVVFGGSEAALITGFRQAEEKKKPLLGYFYEPQWFFSEIEAGQGQPAALHRGLRRRPGQGRLRLPAVRPEQDRQREVRRPGGPRRTSWSRIQWTNDDQNLVANYIAEDKMSPGRRRGQVGRRQPGQGQGLARS